MARPAADGRSFLRLFLLLYVFVTAAVAVNLFLLGLAGTFVGLPSPAPSIALLIAIPIGFPATWFTTRWVRDLIDQAEK